MKHDRSEDFSSVRPYSNKLSILYAFAIFVFIFY